MDWSQISLVELRDMIRKRMATIILIFCVTVGSVAIYSLRQKPVYQAMATISIGPDYYRKLPVEQIFAYDSEGLFLATQFQVLRSRAVAEGIAKALKLDANGDAGVNTVRGALTVERQPESRIFFIRARSGDPALARDIVQAAVQVYSDLSVERTLESSRKSISWLTEQILDMKKKVEDSEMALIKYIEDENLTSSSDGAAAAGGARDASEPYSLGDDKTVQDLNEELIKTELDLEKLRARFGGKYPTVARLNAEIDMIQSRLQAEKKKIIEGNKKKIRYNILRRDAELNKELYNLFMKELKETNVMAEMGMSNVTVINDAELPTSPIAPRKKFNMLMGVLVGLFLGLAGAFAQEHLDRSLKTEDDVRRHLGLPLLAFVPKLKSNGDGRPQVLFTADPRSSGSEVFRIMRTNVKFSSPRGEGQVLLVTGTGPLEGKTTVLSNLGNIMAQSEERVLLVDTDLRRPRLHEIFRVPREPGVTNLLVEEVKGSEEVIKPSGFHNLDILTSGPLSPNPAELLESRRMKEIIAGLRTSYDRIIFDSPPAGLVADAAILAALVDGVIYVVRAERFDRSLHQQSKAQLDKAKARIYGVVLNSLKAERERYAHYGYYYSEDDPTGAGTGRPPASGPLGPLDRILKGIRIRV